MDYKTLTESLGLQDQKRMDDILQAMYNAHAIKEVSESQLLETAFQDNNIFYYLIGRLGSEGVPNWIYSYHRDVPIIEELGGLKSDIIENIGAGSVKFRNTARLDIKKDTG